MAIILSQVGWRTAKLVGGYKTYRRWVQQRLYEAKPRLDFVLIDGSTGTAKTAILGRLAERGVQTLDLEGLARHRGSLFGALPGLPQPSQKLFESRLLAALDCLDPARPIVVEAESSKIGEIVTPPAIWAAMQAAPRIVLEADRAERARYLVAAYADIVEHPERLTEIMARIPIRLGRERLAHWRALADAHDFASLAEALMEVHYDPAYARSARTDERPVLATIPVASLDAAGQNAAADAIAALALRAGRIQEASRQL
jgi:tRNA 2-selenouridine synthase